MHKTNNENKRNYNMAGHITYNYEYIKIYTFIDIIDFDKEGGVAFSDNSLDPDLPVGVCLLCLIELDNGDFLIIILLSCSLKYANKKYQSQLFQDTNIG